MSHKARSRNESGEFREKRSDAKIENLKKKYPIFEGTNGNTILGTLKKKYNTDSLDGVIRGLKKEN